MDFLLTAKRDLAAARRFFERAINLHDLPVSITIDKRGANTAAINSVIADTGADVLLRQSKYLNNRVEQNHRAVKRITRPMLGFKAFRSAARVIAGIETMHMIEKGQCTAPKANVCPPLSSSTAWRSDHRPRRAPLHASMLQLRQNAVSDLIKGG